MFRSRVAAGNLLAATLIHLRIQAQVVVGIARGGMLVAFPIAKKLKLPLEVLIIKKLSAPANPELAIGAIGPDDATYIDSDFVNKMGIPKTYLHQEITKKHHKLTAQMNFYPKQKAVGVTGKRVILVDDGTATGATILAAHEWLRSQRTSSINLCLPVVPFEVADKLCRIFDKCVILKRPKNFQSVSNYFTDFHEVTDEEVIQLMEKRY